MTVNVFSPEPGLCGVWEALSSTERDGGGGLLTELEGRPAPYYFDERDGLHAWLALRLRAHEVDGARQRGQDVVDAILSRAPGEVARHRRLRVTVAAAPATARSWEKEKWLLAPRAGESLARPTMWSHYELDPDGLKLTVVWASANKQLVRVDTAENLDRVQITVHERHPPLAGPNAASGAPRRCRRTRHATVTLRKPVGRREVCDGFDSLPRTIAD